jgi:hypothetical protein
LTIFSLEFFSLIPIRKYQQAPERVLSGCLFVSFNQLIYFEVSIMSSDESITLNPSEHDKLGVYHCGVTREGRIAVAGDPRNIEDGESVYFERSGITATRNGSEYTFSHGQESKLAKAS